jgi:hypothetical protein
MLVWFYCPLLIIFLAIKKIILSKIYYVSSSYNVQSIPVQLFELQPPGPDFEYEVVVDYLDCRPVSQESLLS